jgi:hypothetical protein
MLLTLGDATMNATNDRFSSLPAPLASRRIPSSTCHRSRRRRLAPLTAILARSVTRKKKRHAGS